MSEEGTTQPSNKLLNYLENYLFPLFVYDPKLGPQINLSRTFNTYYILVHFLLLIVIFTYFSKICAVVFYVMSLVVELIAIGLLIPSRIWTKHLVFYIQSISMVGVLLVKVLIFRLQVIDPLYILKAECQQIYSFFKEQNLQFTIDQTCRTAQTNFITLIIILSGSIIMLLLGGVICVYAYRQALHNFNNEEEMRIKTMRFRQIAIKKLQKKLLYTIEISQNKRKL